MRVIEPAGTSTADFEPAVALKMPSVVEMDLGAPGVFDLEDQWQSDKDDAPPADPEQLARTAAMILSAMDAASDQRDDNPMACERREDRTERVGFRVPATLKLFADPVDAEPWPLFLRDVEARAAGFVCPDRVPLGYGGTLEFLGPDGRPHAVDVTLVRCRVCYAGWYEGALYFHRNQPDLLDSLIDNLRDAA